MVVPPETQARNLLNALLKEPETGGLLSRVTHALRAYFGAAFGFAEGELTTGEFCRALKGAPEPGAELKARVCGFLRECDERKFSPGGPPSTMGAASQALKLVNDAEARRAELRAAAAAGQPGGNSGSRQPTPPAPGSSTA